MAGNERNAVKNTWATYQTNGKNMRNAVASTVNSMLPAAYFGAPGLKH
ncbi:MAG: hypothetical protein IPO07_31515 [Haliscomenobacter sp.]|nr:hypothetical protein [Haliscomenobacter sp.]MBK9492806.1 hypothetical protein [Haliscomenobacter sp.]